MEGMEGEGKECKDWVTQARKNEGMKGGRKNRKKKKGVSLWKKLGMSLNRGNFVNDGSLNEMMERQKLGCENEMLKKKSTKKWTCIDTT